MKRSKPNTGDKSFASHPAGERRDDEAARAASTFAPHAPDALTLSERVRLGVRNLDWELIGRILAVKFLVIAFGGIFYKVWQNQPFDSWLGWLDLWNRWDSVHYQSIAQQGYQTVGDERFSIVFFPLYPLLIRAVAFFVRNYLVSAFIVSGVASIVAGWLLKRLAKADEGEAISQRAVWFFIIFPTSYFLHIGYTESLFLALVLGCFVAARRGHWYLAGSLSLLAALCRVNGLILFPVLFVEALEEYRATRRWRWEWLWMLGALLGFACYLGMNYYVTGNALTFMTYQREHFFKQLTAPWMGMRGAFNSMWRQPSEAHMIGFEEFFFAALGLVCTIFCARLLRLSYAVWMILNWFLFTGTTFMVSVPRYTLTLFPIYILFARLSQRPFWNEVMTAWSLLFLALFAGLFASGHWAF